MLSTEVVLLEELRQQIQDLEWEISKHTDQVDHGRPNPKPTREVLKLREQSKAARAQLHTAIEAVRGKKPAVFMEWVNYHKGQLERIQAETSTEPNADTRRNMAGFALKQWEKVTAGEQEFVYINQHFLKDYAMLVSSNVPRQPPLPKEDPTPAEASKPWWQFWK